MSEAKQQVNIGGEWYELIREHQHGDLWQYCYVALTGGMNMTWAKSPLPTRPAPVVDDEGHEVTADNPVKGVELRNWLNGGHEAFHGSQLIVDGIHAGFWKGNENYREPIPSEPPDCRYPIPRRDDKGIRQAASLRNLRDKVRAERAATQMGDGWEVGTLCGWEVGTLCDNGRWLVRRGIEHLYTDGATGVANYERIFFPTRADAEAALAKWRAAQQPPPPDLAERVGVVVGELEKYADLTRSWSGNNEVAPVANALVTLAELVREMAAKVKNSKGCAK